MLLIHSKEYVNANIDECDSRWRKKTIIFNMIRLVNLKNG